MSEKIYLEYLIPPELEDELSEYIEKRIKEFEESKVRHGLQYETKEEPFRQGSTDVKVLPEPE